VNTKPELAGSNPKGAEMAHILETVNTNDLLAFIAETAEAWQSGHHVRKNTYSVGIYMTLPGKSLTIYAAYSSESRTGEHGADWYDNNIEGKAVACHLTGLDSDDAVRLHPYICTGNKIFAWPGGVIRHYLNGESVIVVVSGLTAAEDKLLANTTADWIDIQIKRYGRDAIEAADETNGNGEGRFTNWDEMDQGHFPEDL
jgi:hypothetical protein